MTKDKKLNIKYYKEEYDRCRASHEKWGGHFGYIQWQYNFKTWMNEFYPGIINKLPAFMSIDAETDGLWGPAFCIAITLHNIDGDEISHHVFTYENYIEDVKNAWVKENVLPSIFIPADAYVAKSRLAMLKAFADLWLEHKDYVQVVWHMGHVVEAGLFRELRELELIGDFDAPYTPIEVSTLLAIVGKSPDSVDTFAKKHNLLSNIYGSTHDPLYDCRVTMAVFSHIMRKTMINTYFDNEAKREIKAFSVK